jgi:hypothetical protein
MRYRVYTGSAGSADVSLARDQALFKEFTTLDEALSFARHVERSGTTPLLIEGDDGTHMGKREIAAALRTGDRADVRSP